MQWCEQNYGNYNKYRTRRNNTRAYVEELESQGKLTSGGLTEEGFDSQAVNNLYCYPFKGSAKITCGYGYTDANGKQNYNNGNKHRGIDFGIPTGTELYAATDGIIESFDQPYSSTIYSGNDSKWYGNFCVIHADDGHHILYCHMLKTAGKSGRISKGDYIGISDNSGNSSGAHLHFEIRTSTKYGTDIDPTPFLQVNNIIGSKVNFG